jgi:hypothetical protein
VIKHKIMRSPENHERNLRKFIKVFIDVFHRCIAGIPGGKGDIFNKFQGGDAVCRAV